MALPSPAKCHFFARLNAKRTEGMSLFKKAAKGAPGRPRRGLGYGLRVRSIQLPSRSATPCRRVPARAHPPEGRLRRAHQGKEGAENLCKAMHSLRMCSYKISGSVEMWGGTRSSLLQSQIFYVYRPRPPAFRYVPIVRGSGVSEQGVPLFGGLSTHPVFSGIGRGLERGASSMATTGQCWPPHGAWGAGDTCPLPPPLCLLITPTQQPRHQQRRLKALVGAEPAESPEGHGAGACGGGARRLGAESGSWKSSTRPS